MKLKHLLAATLATAIGIGLLPARTWTSADGNRTFEGDLKAYDKEAGKVTVIMRNGRSVTFDTAKLSDLDRVFLEENAGDKAGDGGDGGADVAAALQEQKIGSKLSKKGVLHKLDGKKFGKFELTKAPEYYLVYYSASW